ncbi:MAG TPA: hypothetical protein VLU47_11130, partial [Blastocatellia bacterium]|nr:hypothetical protein [Blastocatellia bacterium]
MRHHRTCNMYVAIAVMILLAPFVISGEQLTAAPSQAIAVAPAHQFSGLLPGRLAGFAATG